MGLFGYMQSWHCTVDKGYVGFRMRYAVEEKTRETLAGVAETIQQRDQPDPVCYRAIHSSSENLADPIHPL